MSGRKTVDGATDALKEEKEAPVSSDFHLWFRTRLEEARLEEARLEEARLEEAQLEAARLEEARLEAHSNVRRKSHLL
ncbi:unnamed protein product [Pleuronectes platessa]|uniref:Uncharacterized protein n=1 Tax=Pleuronectes platessa TaxID=8262 RepID=A0A9N7VFM2_PLEPL|nr:unnamed protein product [Pleuronectes platessa]